MSIFLPQDFRRELTIEKFGLNRDVDTGAPETIWTFGGLYFFDTSAISLDILSSSALDAEDQTGARYVIIQGLDEDYALQEVTVTMNGITPVSVPGLWMRVFRAQVFQTGGNDSNVGDIDIRNTADDSQRAEIGAGLGQTEMAVYTVPKGYTAYITSYHGSPISGSSGTTVEFDLYVRHFGCAFRLTHGLGLRLGGGNYFRHPFDGPIRVPEKSDIKLDAVSSANNVDVHGGFTLIMSQ